MNSKALRWCLSLLLLAMSTGCAGLCKAPQPLTFSPEVFPSGLYAAKADNFQIQFDASMSMGNKCRVNFLTAKNFVDAVNASLPSDFVANMGLRTFGHSERQSMTKTELVTGMSKYSRDDMKNGLEKIKYPGGNTPLGAAIDAASANFDKMPGTAVLVIVSDGTRNNLDDPVASAKKIKEKMGDRICIYTVWVGDDVEGKKVLENISKAVGCGFTESAANLTDPKALATFVEKAFLNRKAAPSPVAAPAPAPALVPAPQKGVITFNLLFDFDKADIKDEMIPMLEQAKTLLNEDPAAAYVISGHTCNIGTDDYNQELSESRAYAVQDWLFDNGIDPSRLESIGYGESQPKYDNSNEDGRKLNRRAEIRLR